MAVEKGILSNKPLYSKPRVSTPGSAVDRDPSTFYFPGTYLYVCAFVSYFCLFSSQMMSESPNVRMEPQWKGNYFKTPRQSQPASNNSKRLSSPLNKASQNVSSSLGHSASDPNIAKVVARAKTFKGKILSQEQRTLLGLEPGSGRIGVNTTRRIQESTGDFMFPSKKYNHNNNNKYTKKNKIKK